MCYTNIMITLRNRRCCLLLLVILFLATIVGGRSTGRFHGRYIRKGRVSSMTLRDFGHTICNTRSSRNIFARHIYDKFRSCSDEADGKFVFELMRLLCREKREMLDLWVGAIYDNGDRMVLPEEMKDHV